MLIFGIIASLALRGVFIAVGATLLSLLSFTFLIFGLLLIWTAVQLYRRGEDPDVANNALVRMSRRILPVTDTYHDGKLISRTGGRRVVTPLFIVVITIGGTDILFALDSIPAVFGVTDQPYIVFTANAFALLGPRALLFLVTGLLDRLVYLSGGLALILAFIGVKLILHWGHGLDPRVPEITTAVSLAVIAGVLGLTTVASLIKSRRDPAARAHAGAVIGTPPPAPPISTAAPAADPGLQKVTRSTRWPTIAGAGGSRLSGARPGRSFTPQTFALVSRKRRPMFRATLQLRHDPARHIFHGRRGNCTLVPGVVLDIAQDMSSEPGP